MDEPLLYESWGKNQTFILAFSQNEVVDVTDKYTRRAKENRERHIGSFCGRALVYGCFALFLLCTSLFFGFRVLPLFDMLFSGGLFRPERATVQTGSNDWLHAMRTVSFYT